MCTNGQMYFHFLNSLFKIKDLFWEGSFIYFLNFEVNKPLRQRKILILRIFFFRLLTGVV